MQKILVEMLVPQDCDPSELLEKFQSIALELAEEYDPECELEWNTEARAIVEDAVSVEVAEYSARATG